MGLILDGLAGVADPAAARERAAQLVATYGTPHYGEIPTGDVNCAGDPALLKKYLHDAQLFYGRMDEIFGAQLPEPLKRSRERFRNNVPQMILLANTPPGDISQLPAHEFFPYCEDFDTAVRAHLRYAWHTISVDEVRFTSTLLGSGGFADVYKAYHGGQPLALKLFRHDDMLSRAQKTDRQGHLSYHIRRNVAKNADLLCVEPFLAPKIIATDYFKHWYVLEYGEGESVDKLLERSRVDRETAARALHAYARMLKHLHEHDACFVDNNWGAVLVSDEQARICDYDFVAKVEDLQRGDAMSEYHVRCYTTRERLLEQAHTKTADLESFALMADHLLLNDTFYDACGQTSMELRASAAQNTRTYPGDRKSRLPKHLRQVIAPLIRYPRDESIRADDFLEAVRLDYGL